jgi:hypothetical protein
MVHSIANKRAETELALFTCVQKARPLARPAPQYGIAMVRRPVAAVQWALHRWLKRQHPAFPKRQTEKNTSVQPDLLMRRTCCLALRYRPSARDHLSLCALTPCRPCRPCSQAPAKLGVRSPCMQS